MLRSLLGALFSRWMLLTLLLLAAIAVVWIVGPLVAIGERHPLDTERARWITSAALILMALALVAWSLWRARHGNAQVLKQLAAAPPPGAPAESADMAAVRERFETALGTLRQQRFGPRAGGSWWARLGQRLGGRYLYELPWYLIIGAPGAGKTTALQHSGLQFPLADQLGEQALRGVGGTRQCEWWFTDRAVLIDTAGRFTTQDSDPSSDKATWAGFLALLKRSRPRQPLNGVLIAVAATDLLAKGAAERARHAQLVRARLQELHEQLGIRLPIYLLVTKCDLLAGFAEQFAGLDKAQRQAPWGFAFAMQPQAFTQAFGSEFDALLARLDQGLVDRLQAEPDPVRRARIYGFPGQFASLRATLDEFTRQAFAPSPFEPDPLLRGVYFVSGTQEGTPIDRVLGAVARRYRIEQAVLPPQRASGRSFFLERLLGEVVFAEQGLAGTRRGWERRRAALAIAGYASVAAVTLAVIGAWSLSWRDNRAYIGTVAARVEAVRQQVQRTPDDATPDLLPLLPALRGTRSLAEAGAGAGHIPWSMGFGLYQGRRLDEAALIAYEQMLRDAVLPRLALRFEQELRAPEPSESQYEALKGYLMMYDLPHFDAPALKRQIEADWDARLTRGITPDQRGALSKHLDALLAQGPAMSPIAQDKALVDAIRTRLAVVPLPQRVYERLRQRGLGDQFPEFTLANAAGANGALVFTRASGLPLTRGVPGLFTYKGYHQGFQSVVSEATAQLASEQTWVLGVTPTDAAGAGALQADDRLVDDVRRLYLNDYRDTWKTFIADIRLVPQTSIAQAAETTRILSAPDNPMVPLLKAMSHETTLLGGSTTIDRATNLAQGQVQDLRNRVLGILGAQRATTGAPGQRIESIVDDEFAGLHRLVTTPDGGQAPIEAVVARLRELQVLLTAVQTALAGGGPPPPSPLPTQIKAEAATTPEPVRSLLDTLGTASARVALMQLRETLSRDVRAQIGDFCHQAVSGRYPFDPQASREVTPADFTSLFGPGGKFDLEQQKLAPYIDTSTRPWSFRPVDGTPLGTDTGSLPQFQRAAAIRETFFSGGQGPAVQLAFKPVEMDARLREFILDVDGQLVRYDHGPQIPQPVRWPGPRGSNVVRVTVQPSLGAGLVSEGPWALFRLFDTIQLQPGAAPEKFRATFDIAGRAATFDVTAASVRNPFRMTELRSFSCPDGL